MNKKVTKVEITYDNGDVIWVEGEEAEKWQKFVRASDIMYWVHGGQDPGIKWQEKKIEK